MMGRVGGGVTRVMLGACSPVRTHGATATHITASPCTAEFSSVLLSAVASNQLLFSVVSGNQTDVNFMVVLIELIHLISDKTSICVCESVCVYKGVFPSWFQ